MINVELQYYIVLYFIHGDFRGKHQVHSRNPFPHKVNLITN